MNDKTIETLKLKLKIIALVLKYEKNPNKHTLKEIKELLDLFASIYTITTKKVPKIALDTALIEFVENGKGYNYTISKLYNSL